MKFYLLLREGVKKMVKIRELSKVGDINSIESRTFNRIIHSKIEENYSKFQNKAEIWLRRIFPKL